MTSRTPRLVNAFIEVGFVVVAGVLGAMQAPLWSVPALAAAMLVYWIVNRWNSLDQIRKMSPARLAGIAVFSLALISVVLGAAFWLGRIIKI